MLPDSETVGETDLLCFFGSMTRWRAKISLYLHVAKECHTYNSARSIKKHFSNSTFHDSISYSISNKMLLWLNLTTIV